MPFEFALRTGVQDVNFLLQHASRRLHICNFSRSRRCRRINQHREGAGFRDKLVQQFNPLGAKQRRHHADARNIPAWMAQTCDNASLNRIATTDEDNRRCPCRRLGRFGCNEAAARDDDVRGPVDKLSRQAWQQPVIPIGPPKINRYIFVNHEAFLAKTLAKGGDKFDRIFRRSAAEKANHRHAGLKRARHRRSHRGQAKR